MNDDRRLLANAALDGDVTDVERARAEADPEVAAEIERLRRVRRATRAVAAPDAARRESAIAAALAAFDALDRSGDDAPRPPTVIAPRPPTRAAHRRNRWVAPLAAAAAVAVIAVGGIVATRGASDDHDDAATSELSAEQSAGDQLDDADRELTAAAPAPVDDPTSGEADSASEATSAAAAPAGTVGPSTAADTTQELAPSAGAVPLTSPEDLVAFVAATAGSGVEEDVTATCSGGSFVGIASYVVAGEAVEVEVFEVAAPHEAVARRVDECVVVARAPLP